MRGRLPVLCGCPVGPWRSSHTGCHLAHVSLYPQAQPEGAAGVHFPPACRLQEVRPGRRCRGRAGQQPGGGARQDRQQRGRERWCWRCRSWRRRSRHRRRYVMHTTRCTGCPKPASHTHIHQTPTLSMAMHSYLCLPRKLLVGNNIQLPHSRQLTIHSGAPSGGHTLLGQQLRARTRAPLTNNGWKNDGWCRNTHANEQPHSSLGGSHLTCARSRSCPGRPCPTNPTPPSTPAPR